MVYNDINKEVPVISDIRNIAFEGGGVLGTAYVGAIEILEEKGIMQKIENIAGTSAGSIVSLMVALRYNAAEIKNVLFNLDYTKFEDNGDYLRLLSKYGHYKQIMRTVS